MYQFPYDPESPKTSDSDAVSRSLNVNDFRNSINEIRNSLNTAPRAEQQVHANNEKRWRLSYLKEQFEALQLHKLFKRYTERINHGYFSQYLSLHIILTTSHFILVLASNSENPGKVLPDLILYALAAALSVFFLVVCDGFVKKKPRLLSVLVVISFLTLFFTNVFVPIYYKFTASDHFRPAYSTHLIISCYVFFNFDSNLVAMALGLFVSICHIATLIVVTYGDIPLLWERVLSDAIYLGCINGVGLYFRYMNEIVKRRSFLDRRSCVESTFQLKFEEEQENQLMSSIIPQHIIEKVRNDIIKYWEDIENLNTAPRHRPFTDPYVEVHDNVTILFADIVNYTEMTSTLNINDLLDTLNELFGRFDDASEQLKVLRIKFLGDCYYCVAGLPPEPAPNHAEACVDLGLKMISIITDVKKRRNLNVDMRIGIHTGRIISGIIGSIKWQYDVWSNDVDIANKMESQGCVGKVHITEVTKNLLEKSYAISAPYKTVNNLNTYLISPVITPSSPPDVAPTSNGTPSGTPNGTSNGTPNGETVSKRRLTYVKRNPFNEVSGSLLANLQNAQTVPRLGGVSPGSAEIAGVPTPNGTPVGENRRRLTYMRRNPFNDLNGSILAQLHSHNNAQTPPIQSMSAPSFAPLSPDIMEEGEVNQRRDTIYRKQPLGNGIERRYSGNPSLGSLHRRIRISTDRRLTAGDGKRRTAFMNNNINRYKERLTETNRQLEDTIENMLVSKYEQWFKGSDMNPLFLFFKNLKSELHFVAMPDPLFKYYLLTEIVLLIIVFIMENLTQSKWDWSAWPFYVTIGLIVFLFVPLTWTHYLWTRHISKYAVGAPKNRFIKFFYDKSKFVTNNVIARIVIYTIVCVLFCICVLVELLDCETSDGEKVTYTSLLHLLFRVHPATKEPTDSTITCTIPWHMTETTALAMIMTFLFLRMYMWIKFAYAAIIAIVYSVCVWNFRDDFYKGEETFNYGVKPQVAHVVSVVFLTVILHLVDRQTEYMNRLDHLWYETLIEKQKQASSVHVINKMLLKNILPIHVAEIYLDVGRRSSEGLYHENYDLAAVMFASIVDYSTEDMGENFLTVMNAIICDFDTSTLSNSFGRPIEKIKVAKWTYMAACGLVPGLGDTVNMRRDQHNHAVVSLIKFASCLMKKLKAMNSETHQEMKLRVGIAYGPIAAGVVGSKKPLYDIWGDPVNMASRMDTTGLPNQIQVLEGTAAIIRDYGFECDFRDLTKVKGRKHLVPTYFVTLDENFDLIQTESNE